ncbi:hypothetical protein N2152v2_008554 [Parachlorella kessleri]
MFSGLYGDLPQAKDEDKKAAGGWAGSGLMAPTKRTAAMAPPPSVLRAAGGRGRGREGPPPVAGGRGGGRGPGPAAAAASGTPKAAVIAAAAAAETTPVLASAAAAAQQASSAAAAILAAATGGMSLGQDLKEEYDPTRPNDYEQVRKERERLRKEAEAEAERQERLRELKELEELEMQRQEEEPEPLPPTILPPAAIPAAGAAPQEPMQLDESQRREALSLSGEEAFRRRAMLSGGGGGAPAPGEGAGEGGLGLGSAAGGLGFGAAGTAGGAPGAGQPKGMGLAQKLLEKMGWKEGEGLGRNRQGMSAPLMMQKTDVRSGVIVSAGAGGPPPEKRPKQGAVITGTPSKVVLLTNVVGPGEVDDQLEDEVGQECTKYGAVQSVMIFEATEPGFPYDQAVRVFVEFGRIEEATKCLVDMQGRFFGGRTVHASFFDEERYERNDLAPRPEEVRR